ncbi:antibiotic biosynthesis monooxygenase [Erysipelotrichaceae bacterium RD49]|nr:antibiotic biosynthesis monooxygenase [Erysipelotrichaceae bacterium RD49]
MSIVVNLYYTGKDGAARKFVKEMTESGLVEYIRNEPGNERYEYFFPADDPETVLLIDRWENQEAIDRHHALPVMGEIVRLRDKYDLSMKVERFTPNELPEHDQKFIRK